MSRKQDIDLAVDQLMRATVADPELALEAAKQYYQHVSKVTKKPSLWIKTIELLARKAEPPIGVPSRPNRRR